MLVWAVGATALSLILIVIFCAYRRQIRNICRQMAFLREQKTNLLLGQELPFSELNELIDCINECVEQARESERAAEKRNKALKEVITGLSHDIRTPLTSLSGYFQLLAGSYGEEKNDERNGEKNGEKSGEKHGERNDGKNEEKNRERNGEQNEEKNGERNYKRIGEKNDEQRRHYISVIRSRIDSLDDMLEELFTFSRLTDEEYVLETAPVDFKKSVYDTVLSFYDSFNEKGIEPKIFFCEEALPIQANEEAVRRILQNMIKNVLVHGESAVRLTLCREEGGREEKNQESNSCAAVFTCENLVRNPEEIDAARVFERFYKTDAARTHTSSGLGLSTAKELAERMGGKMEAEVVDGWFTVRVRFGLYGFEKTSIKQ